MIRKHGWIALLVLLADQAVKLVARGVTESITLLPGVLAFTYAENTGMAFSMLSGHSVILGLISAGVILIGWYIFSNMQLRSMASVAAMLLLGGAAGNMIDRFVHGYVVDMFEVLAFRFAIFNVADAAITVGCVLMAISLLLRPGDWSEKKHGRKRAAD